MSAPLLVPLAKNARVFAARVFWVCSLRSCFGKCCMSIGHSACAGAAIIAPDMQVCMWQEARARCADKQGGAAEAGQRAAAALAASLALSSMDVEPRVVDARAQLSASPAKPVPAQG